jgi:hypothetical protein
MTSQVEDLEAQSSLEISMGYSGMFGVKLKYQLQQEKRTKL